MPLGADVVFRAAVPVVAIRSVVGIRADPPRAEIIGAGIAVTTIHHHRVRDAFTVDAEVPRASVRSAAKREVERCANPTGPRAITSTLLTRRSIRLASLRALGVGRRVSFHADVVSLSRGFTRPRGTLTERSVVRSTIGRTLAFIRTRGDVGVDPCLFASSGRPPFIGGRCARGDGEHEESGGQNACVLHHGNSSRG